MEFLVMKVYIYKDSCVEGLVPRKTDPVSAGGDITLLLNSEDGFSTPEVSAAIKQFFMCPICNSSIVVEAEYGSSDPPKLRLVDVAAGTVPVYALERTVGHIFYKWQCHDDRGRVCTSANGWSTKVPPALKPDSW